MDRYTTGYWSEKQPQPPGPYQLRMGTPIDYMSSHPLLARDVYNRKPALAEYVSGQRFYTPEELATAKAERDKPVDPYPMTDAGTFYRSKAREQWMKDRAAGLIVKAPMASGYGDTFIDTRTGKESLPPQAYVAPSGEPTMSATPEGMVSDYQRAEPYFADMRTRQMDEIKEAKKDRQAKIDAVEEWKKQARGQQATTLQGSGTPTFSATGAPKVTIQDTLAMFQKTGGDVSQMGAMANAAAGMDASLPEPTAQEGYVGSMRYLAKQPGQVAPERVDPGWGRAAGAQIGSAQTPGKKARINKPVSGSVPVPAGANPIYKIATNPAEFTNNLMAGLNRNANAALNSLGQNEAGFSFPISSRYVFNAAQKTATNAVQNPSLDIGQDFFKNVYNEVVDNRIIAPVVSPVEFVQQAYDIIYKKGLQQAFYDDPVNVGNFVAQTLFAAYLGVRGGTKYDPVRSVEFGPSTARGISPEFTQTYIPPAGGSSPNLPAVYEPPVAGSQYFRVPPSSETYFPGVSSGAPIIERMKPVVKPADAIRKSNVPKGKVTLTRESPRPGMKIEKGQAGKRESVAKKVKK